MAFELEANPYFDLVINCWIPLPNRATDVSTKAIHHHGPMLLTTATVFVPGYERWMLRRPERIKPDRDLFRMDLIDYGRHGLHEVASVDAYTACADLSGVAHDHSLPLEQSCAQQLAGHSQADPSAAA